MSHKHSSLFSICSQGKFVYIIELCLFLVDHFRSMRSASLCWAFLNWVSWELKDLSSINNLAYSGSVHKKKMFMSMTYVSFRRLFQIKSLLCWALLNWVSWELEDLSSANTLAYSGSIYKEKMFRSLTYVYFSRSFQINQISIVMLSIVKLSVVGTRRPVLHKHSSLFRLHLQGKNV